jgi:hypothetical protein
MIIDSSHKAGIENNLVKKAEVRKGPKLSMEDDIVENTESINI